MSVRGSEGLAGPRMTHHAAAAAVADAAERLTQESYMDSVRWDALRITGMENGWLVDPAEVSADCGSLTDFFSGLSLLHR